MKLIIDVITGLIIIFGSHLPLPKERNSIDVEIELNSGTKVSIFQNENEDDENSPSLRIVKVWNDLKVMFR